MLGINMSEEHNRRLTDEERQLARWMLEHGTPEARQYLHQLQLAEVTPWRCPCGCASISFQIKGHPKAPLGVHVLADFLVGEGESQRGAFIFSSQGLLSGLEVYGFAADAPRHLPRPEELRPLLMGGGI
jgi:hypothetical protein